MYVFFHVGMDIPTVAILIAVIIVGTKYILTSSGTSNRIQSALLIVFIAEIDDEVAKMALPKAAYERFPWILKHHLTKVDEHYRQFSRDDSYYIQGFISLLRPVVFVAIVIAIVLGLRHSYC